MKKFYVDVTTINAIETIFRSCKNDPYAISLAAEFAEAFVFHDECCVILPLPEDAPVDISQIDDVPDFLLYLLTSIESVTYDRLSTSRHVPISADALNEQFTRIHGWIYDDVDEAKDFVVALREHFRAKWHPKAVKLDFVFDLTELRADERYKRTKKDLGMSQYDCDKIINFMLKFPYYKDRAGTNYFLTYHLRRRVPFCGFPASKNENSEFALPLADVIKGRLTTYREFSTFISLLLEIKRFIHCYSIHATSRDTFRIEKRVKYIKRFRFDDFVSKEAKKILLLAGLRVKLSRDIRYLEANELHTIFDSLSNCSIAKLLELCEEPSREIVVSLLGVQGNRKRRTVHDNGDKKNMSRENINELIHAARRRLEGSINIILDEAAWKLWLNGTPVTLRSHHAVKFLKYMMSYRSGEVHLYSRIFDEIWQSRPPAPQKASKLRRMVNLHVRNHAHLCDYVEIKRGSGYSLAEDTTTLLICR